jgi:hypothetical protein
MKIDDSNKRYAVIIAGILLITVIPVFVAFALGVMGGRVFTDNGTQPIGGGVPVTSGKNDSVNKLDNHQGNDNLVPGSKSGCCISDMDTEKGSIDVEVQQDNDYELPLCIDEQSDLNGLNKALNITLIVCGGYKPQCGDSYLWLDQGWFCGEDREGKVYIQWIEIQKPDGVCCCWKYYEAEFKYGDKICFVSSQLPDDIPQCWDRYGEQWGDKVKEVDIDLEIYWKGCHFWTIPVSDFQFPESPTPEWEFKNSSPVVCNNYWMHF